MANGYHDRILRVDLSRGSVSAEEPGEVFFRRYFGGAALAAYYMLKEMKPGIDPWSPENKLVFAAGIATGAPVTGVGRNTVAARAPMTGTMGHSEVGGYWGAELKLAGVDAIVVDGASDRPVYLWVHDGQAEIREASGLWGLNTKETEEAIRAELGDSKIRCATIGPAGEKLVRYACVINDLHSAAGRTGMGSVMGSKRLKAIAVRGRGPMKLGDPEKLKAVARWAAANARQLEGGMGIYGTGSGVAAYNLAGNLPTRNFRDGLFEGAEKITAQVLQERYGVRMESCYACAVRCKKVDKTPPPYESDPVYGGPEYETLGAFGSNCGVDDLAAIVYANSLCNAYSMDTISCGCTIAFAMECFERGLLTLKDTDGIDLRFGNAQAMVQAVEKIAKREGIGDLLAEGVKRVAEKVGQGSEEFAVHVKGLEFGMHEPRLKFALGLGYAVNAHGGDHNLGFHDTSYDKDKTSGWPSSGTSSMMEMRALGFLDVLPANDLSDAKVAMYRAGHNWRSMQDCLVMCGFMPYTHQQVVEIVEGVTGWNSSVHELMAVGERAVNMMKAFNVREGFKPADDRLPPRSFLPTIGGALANQAQDPESFERAKRSYYSLMGWDVETACPTRAKLGELGIGWVAEELANQGKLPR